MTKKKQERCEHKLVYYCILSVTFDVKCVFIVFKKPVQTILVSLPQTSSRYRGRPGTKAALGPASLTSSCLQGRAVPRWPARPPPVRPAPSPAAARRCSPRRWRRRARCTRGGRRRRSPLSAAGRRARRPACCGRGRSPPPAGRAGSPCTGSTPPGRSAGTGPRRRRSCGKPDGYLNVLMALRR